MVLEFTLLTLRVNKVQDISRHKRFGRQLWNDACADDEGVKYEEYTGCNHAGIRRCAVG